MVSVFCQSHSLLGCYDDNTDLNSDFKGHEEYPIQVYLKFTIIIFF